MLASDAQAAPMAPHSHKPAGTPAPGLPDAVSGALAPASALSDATWLALVHGAPPSTLALRSATARRRDADPAGSFALIEATSADPATLCAELAKAGFPVVGDTPRAPAAPRLMLHRTTVTAPDPITGALRTVTAPPPALFADLAAGLPALTSPDDAAYAPLFALAKERRAWLEADSTTTFFRLWHGPGDGANHPELRNYTLDRLGSVVICSCYDERVRALPPALIAAIRAAWPEVTAIYAKFRPRVAATVTPAQMAELAPPTPAWGAAVDALTVYEHGQAYLMRPGDGLSVGLYADMRATRARFRTQMAANPGWALNTFAYTCGFGVAGSAANPKARVVNLDLSRRSLDWGKESYALNNLPIEPRDFVFGDVFDWLQRWQRQGRRFATVIVDPPSFARNRGRRWRIEHDYADLITLAARLLEPAGTLIACCNHSGLERSTIEAQIRAGIAAAAWPGTITAAYGADPADYPTWGGAPSHLNVVFVQGDASCVSQR